MALTKAMVDFLLEPQISPYEFSSQRVPALIHEKLWNGKRFVDTYIHISGLEKGPALGGCRIQRYERESEARQNVRELSRGMWYKSALADLPYGGGKALLLADAETEKNERLLGNFAALVNDLHGNYITAEDAGTNLEDMDFLFQHTKYVVGTSKFSGNPSPVTAFGVYKGLKACLKHAGLDSVKGLTFAIKGAGNVANYLVFGFPEDKKYDEFRTEFPGLIHLQPKVIYYHEKIGKRSDDFKAKARKLGLSSKLQRRSEEELYEVPKEVFMPMALRHSAAGEYLQALAASGCRIIAGSENSQLKDEVKDMHLIQQNGIIYAPDFAINAGGLMSVHFEKVAQDITGEYDATAPLRSAAGIENTIAEILDQAKETRRNTLQIAKEFAERRARKIRNRDC